MPSIISKRKRNQPSATSVSFMMLRVSGTGAGSRDNYRRPFKLHWTFLSDEQRIEPSKASDALNSPARARPTPWTVLCLNYLLALCSGIPTAETNSSSTLMQCSWQNNGWLQCNEMQYNGVQCSSSWFCENPASGCSLQWKKWKSLRFWRWG